MVFIIPVLFVDDNRELTNIFQFYLEETGLFKVHICLSGQDALLYLKDNEIQAVISDLDMPDMDGIVLLCKIKESYPDLPFIMLTSNDCRDTAALALNSGADFYQNKAENLDIQVIDLTHKIIILVEKAKAEAALKSSDLVLDIIVRAAGRLLKGEDFNTGMVMALKELGLLTGATGAFIGDPFHQKEDPDGRPGIICWWDEGNGENEKVQKMRTFEIFADLTRAAGTKNGEDAGIFISHDNASMKELSALSSLGVSCALLIPAMIPDERAGYLALFFTRQRAPPSGYELNAYSTFAKLARAAMALHGGSS
ncbi:MAG: response regulator [Methanomicrobiales archaeon]|nr:response regulator [Methanomicrobiales archaeon]